jgi:hypothetical protein
MTTDHICHCAICAASRAFDALLELEPLLPGHAEVFATARVAFDCFLNDAAEMEMRLKSEMDDVAAVLFGRDGAWGNSVPAAAVLARAKEVMGV